MKIETACEIDAANDKAKGTCRDILDCGKRLFSDKC